MADESTFLEAILANPSHTALRLAYADWLDEHGDAQSSCRSEYLRVECELDSLPPRSSRRRKLRDQLGQFRASVGDDWWRMLDYARVQYCVQFTYRCPQRWDMLTPTADPAVRLCAECNEQVHYCRTPSEAHQRADQGQCVAIDVRMALLPFGRYRSSQRTGRLLGRVAPTVQQRIPLPLRGQSRP